ncbi:MAG TPA: nucleotide exchange factor GrpE [Candidatus Binatia bacterium]|jgi:molecular chaperone GrpE|nr:nucleotide exchange factor GrpE [Candidatus Binatia bacterium]
MTRDDKAQQPVDEGQQEEQEIEGDVPSSTVDGDVELTIEEQLANAEARAAEYLEGWQRARAEFSNARKRMDRDRAEARRNATIEVVSRLLPILDDFERALDSVPEEVAANTWFEGVALVYRKLRSILETVDIERIEALGQPFDPNLHEAVLQEESDEHESGIVIKELQKGYRLNDRVIRPAMVVVAA